MMHDMGGVYGYVRIYTLTGIGEKAIVCAPSYKNDSSQEGVSNE